MPPWLARRAAARNRTAERALDVEFFARMTHRCDAVARALADDYSTSVITIHTDTMSRDAVGAAVRDAVALHVNAINRECCA